MEIKNRVFDNVTYRIDKAQHSFEELLESEYMGNIILALSEQMGANFRDYEFIIYSQPNHSKSAAIFKPVFTNSSGRKQVVLYISDESSFVPDEMAAQVFAVFKHRLTTDIINHNIFSLPTGCNRTTKHLEIIPINKRKYNVFFFGQMSAQRMGIYKALAHLNWVPTPVLNRFKFLLKRVKTNLDAAFPHSFIRFTARFKQGYGPDHYAATLYNSKIALCPYGNSDQETFRHFEAMRAGCIVISQAMPDVFYFKGAPIIQLDDWSQLDKVVQDLMKDPVRMEALHRRTLDWWQAHCAEEAVAAYIARRLYKLEEKKGRTHKEAV